MRIKGFTSLELLVVLALFILFAVSTLVVSSHFLVERKLQKILAQLEQGIQYARAQALVLGRPLQLTPDRSASDWSQGMVLTDISNQHAGKPIIITRWQWRLPAGYLLEWHGAQLSSAIVFVPDLQHAMSNGHFSFIQNGVEWRRVIMNRLGSVHVLCANKIACGEITAYV